MRYFVLREPCRCTAETFWKLREDPDWNAFSASQDGQTYTPLVRTRTTTDRGTQMHHVSRLDQRYPSTLLRVLPVHLRDPQVCVTTCWWTTRYDEHHPCTIDIHVPLLGNRFRISGCLWIESTARRDVCLLCTSYTIDVRASLLTRRIEEGIEERIRKSYRDQPGRVHSYLSARRALDYDLVARPVDVPTAGAIPVTILEIEHTTT